MANRAYGQYCGLARAMEMVGERWALLIVRDLLVGPRRFGELHRGLGIPTNILTARLKELEEAGVIRRRLMPRPAAAVVYELTPYGAQLEDAVVQLGRWGAKSLGEPREGETITPDSLIMALRSTFRAERARGAHTGFELRAGPIVIHARVDDGSVEVGEGALPEADLVIEAGPGIKALMAHELSADEALERGIVKVTGDPALLARFGEMFSIDPMPPERAAG